ncbi:MAG: hypothetical protein IPO58_15910 [Betaproteobacteria bacterium]|nr:hypothetical protein [Betaproteobacteria bacterium]
MMIITGAAFAYPDRPMRLIVGFPAGGDTDVLARIMADAMAPILGHPIIVDNKPGADAQIAVSNLKNSPADGYSMMMVSVTSRRKQKVYPELHMINSTILCPLCRSPRHRPCCSQADAQEFGSSWSWHPSLATPQRL